MRPIKNWHIVISGFLQDVDKPTGMLRLWRELHYRHSGPETVVQHRAWSDCVETLAQLIFRCTITTTPVIRIYGYSWGGYSSVLLAKELRGRGLDVESLVLSDPVYRHYYALGQWRALVPWSRIHIPDNVRRVVWFRQRENLPAGHDLIADSRSTDISKPVVLTRRHTFMDDAPEFHAAAIAAAGGKL